MPARRFHLLLAALSAVAVADQACSFETSAAAVHADAEAADSAGEMLSLAQRLAQRRKVPALRNGNPPFSLRLPQPIDFIKTHRTGSSTMTNILNRLVLRRNLTKLFPTTEPNIDWPILKKTVEPNHQFDVICNHQTFDEQSVRAYLKPLPFIFFNLRQPISIVDSYFRFLTKATNRKDVMTWAERLEYMEHNKASVSNPIARDLGWYGTTDISRIDPDGETLFRNDTDEEAIRNFILKIDRAVDMVVLTEHYDEGVVFFMHKLQLGIDDVAYIKMKEDTAVKDAPPPTPDELKRLNEFLHVDIALYEYFSNRFWSQFHAHGGFNVLGSDIQALKERNAELEVLCAEPRKEDSCPAEFTLDSILFDRVLRAMPTSSYTSPIPKVILDQVIG